MCYKIGMERIKSPLDTLKRNAGRYEAVILSLAALAGGAALAGCSEMDGDRGKMAPGIELLESESGTIPETPTDYEGY